MTLALAALAATLSDERRARRFIDLTGIGTDELRARAGEPSLLAALIRFLEGHEPDLLSVAEAVGLYRRLRERGQSSVLARLSVEARCGKLTPEQRRLVNELLRAHEHRSA